MKKKAYGKVSKGGKRPACGKIVEWDGKKQGPSKTNKGFGRP